MKTAYDVMTRALATCSPNTPVWQAAQLMRDLNIGDVLVTENNKLRGIVTDRDLAVQALATHADKRNEPVSNYMTTDVVTGEADWPLDRIADIMGRNQIRRLPILDHGDLVGIVSLGDVAVHFQQKQKVGKSLEEISEMGNYGKASSGSRWLGMALMMLGLVGALALVMTRQGRDLREQIANTDMRQMARQVEYKARETMNDPNVRRMIDQSPVQDLMNKVRS